MELLSGIMELQCPWIMELFYQIDLTDKITSYGEEYSIAIRALGTTDKVKFFSKEKQLTDGVGGFAPQMSVWPNISFK